MSDEGIWVLAVMAASEETLRNQCCGEGVLAGELEEARAAVSKLIERDRIRYMELEHCRAQYMRAIKVLSAIEMRCAPDDITLLDGQVRRFIPPDPELYWRELSAKVKAAGDEVRAIFDADDAAAIARATGSKS